MPLIHEDRSAGPMVGREKQRLLALPDLDLSTADPSRRAALPGFLRTLDRRFRAPVVPGTVALALRRRTFAWDLSLRARLGEESQGAGGRDVEVLLHHEVLTPAGPRLLFADPPLGCGHPVESDPAFVWRSTSGVPYLAWWRSETSARQALHGAFLAVEDFRQESLLRAHVSLESLDLGRSSLARLNASVVEVALESLVLEPTGHLARAFTSRPPLVHALALALGQRPGAWSHADDESSPLRLLVDGHDDRDVLAHALELGRGLEATDARLTRLRTLGGRTRPWTRRLAYLAHTLDVDCPNAWVPTDERGLDAWAMAQCWAQTCVLAQDHRDDFLRYVARHGAELGGLLESPLEPARLRSLLGRRLPAAARELLANGLGPRAFVRRAVRAGAPAPNRHAWLAERIRRADTRDDGIPLDVFLSGWLADAGPRTTRSPRASRRPRARPRRSSAPTTKEPT